MLTSTSMSAYDEMQDIIPTIRRAVYQFIYNRGEYGATMREVVDILGNGDYPTWSPRCTELYQQGAVVRVGKRQNRTGKTAHVLVAAPIAAKMAEKDAS